MLAVSPLSENFHAMAAATASRVFFGGAEPLYVPRTEMPNVPELCPATWAPMTAFSSLPSRACHRRPYLSATTLYPMSDQPRPFWWKDWMPRMIAGTSSAE
ncbi:Uncharacterised protein [Mycobacteroides abscessus subsp. abscessus]|nr:Uncharacterised protein [Mycobacteroides abscessus subsp. abscessus]